VAILLGLFGCSAPQPGSQTSPPTQDDASTDAPHLPLGELSAAVRAHGADGVYEGPLVEGVRRFQVRHGLDGDGVIGRATLAAFNVPPAGRVRQIELAPERLRWLPDLGSQRLIALNIPMFRLWTWDDILPDGCARSACGRSSARRSTRRHRSSSKT
jgi:murein L,D-transpeptidase YcbB/YkuD